MKRYILPFDVWDKRLDEIIRMIGKARKKGTKWGGEIREKEMKRLVISGNHHIREGYSGFKIRGIAKLWMEETGNDWILHLFIGPLPF